MTTYEATSLVLQGTIALSIITALLQIRDTRKWNKMSMAISHLPPPHELNELEQELNSSFLRIIDRTDALSDSELTTLLTEPNKELRIKLKNYFNMLEAYCAAVNHGIIDSEVAKSIYRYKFERHFIEFKPYVDKMRSGSAAGYMTEMEQVLSSWQDAQKKKTKYGA